MRIAIVGGGISGNLVARLLAQKHEITLFEANAAVGGHTRTLNVTAFGKDFPVDTGFMVFNERTYPNFCRLLDLLKVTSADADMSLSVRCDNTGLEYQGSSINGLFAQRRNLIRSAFYRLMLDILRFNREAPTWLGGGLGDSTMRDVLAKSNYGGWFVDKYLVPMSAAIWSCPPGRLLDFPAHFLIGFLRNHGLLQVSDRPQWKTIIGGARRYVEQLVSPIQDRIRANTPVAGIWRHADHVVVQPKDGPAEMFDRVVLACHSDQARAMLKDIHNNEDRILRSFVYQANTAVLHTDTTLLPHRRRAWASWNYRVSADDSAPVAVTYDLSRLQRLDSPSPILLTLNGDARIDEAKVLDRFVFQHPVFTRDSLLAQSQYSLINGSRRTYFCGAYWGYGFHEDGVNSALAVAECFGLGLDQWKAVSTKALFTTSV